MRKMSKTGQNARVQTFALCVTRW